MLTELFATHLDKAIKFYREAIERDPSYIFASNNLGCALLMRGGTGDYDEASAIFSRAHERVPQDPKILNNLGVALFYGKKPKDAKDNLKKASELVPQYSTPIFNLAKIAQTERQDAEAERYRQAYERLDLSGSIHASPSGPGEEIEGLTIGASVEQVPPEWGEHRRSTFGLEESLTVTRYTRNGIATLSQENGTILMISVPEAYSGMSARGIKIGSKEQDVRARYGPPTRTLEMTQGQSLSYEAEGQGIAFQIRNGAVVSWLLF